MSSPYSDFCASAYCSSTKLAHSKLPRPTRHRQKALSLFVLFIIGFLVIRLYSIYGFPYFIISGSRIPNDHSLYPSVFLSLSSYKEESLVCSLRTWIEDVQDFLVFYDHKLRLESMEMRQIFQKIKGLDVWNRIRSQSQFLERFVISYDGTYPDWYVFAPDNTFLAINEMKLELSSLNSSQPFFAIIAEENNKVHWQDLASKTPAQITLLSRGALTLLTSQILEDAPGCDLDGSLRDCLEAAVSLNLQQDSSGRNRYYILERHFGPSEMSDFKSENGFYSDSAKDFVGLSPSLISFHNLTCIDMDIINVLQRKVRVWMT